MQQTNGYAVQAAGVVTVNDDRFLYDTRVSETGVYVEFRLVLPEGDRWYEWARGLTHDHGRFLRLDEELLDETGVTLVFPVAEIKLPEGTLDRAMAQAHDTFVRMLAEQHARARLLEEHPALDEQD